MKAKRPDWRCILCGDEATPQGKLADPPYWFFGRLLEVTGHCINCGYGVAAYDKNKKQKGQNVADSLASMMG